MSWYFTPKAGNNIETKRLTLDDGVGNQTALTCEIQHCWVPLCCLATVGNENLSKLPKGV